MCSLFHTHTCSLFHTHTRVYSLFYTHTCSLFYIHTHTCMLFHTHVLSLSHTQTCGLSSTHKYACTGHVWSVLGACGVQKRALCLLCLEFWAVVSRHVTWVLGTNPWSSVRTRGSWCVNCSPFFTPCTKSIYCYLHKFTSSHLYFFCGTGRWVVNFLSFCVKRFRTSGI